MSTVAAEVRVSSWEQARRISRALHGWVFRGQSNARYGLSSTLERAAKRAGVKLEFLRTYETNILQQFQRRAHHYIPALPPPTATLEWLALLQHHGAPTRLLDFTHSFYIAAFFACEFTTDDAAVWAVNAPSLTGVLAKKAGIDSIDPLMAALQFEGSAVALCEQAIGSDAPEALAVPVKPWTLNQRLSLQQGLFLCPLDVTRSFEQNLAATLSERPDAFRKPPRVSIGERSTHARVHSTLSKYQVVKFVIPKDRVLRVQTDLDRMNISATTLFPGLDGYARSLHSLIGWESVYDKNEDE
jgi:hypothetical protein